MKHCWNSGKNSGSLWLSCLGLLLSLLCGILPGPQARPASRPDRLNGSGTKGETVPFSSTSAASLRQPSQAGLAINQQHNQKGNREILEMRDPRKGLNSKNNAGCLPPTFLVETMLSSYPGLLTGLCTCTKNTGKTRRQGRLETCLHFEFALLHEQILQEGRKFYSTIHAQGIWAEPLTGETTHIRNAETKKPDSKEYIFFRHGLCRIS